MLGHLSQEGALSIVIKGEKGGESEEAVWYMAAPDSPGTKLHRQSGKDGQNRKTKQQYYKGLGKSQSSFSNSWGTRY